MSRRTHTQRKARALRRRYGRSSRLGYTWAVCWVLEGSAAEALLDYYERGGPKINTKSFGSKKKAEAEVEYLLHRGYDAVKFKWWHDEPHFRGIWS